mmetsp:Transcript_19156/g.30592  ORF Transcript_19156/g.30592 Transcript_19156/m.30592 type:complete len:207 (+) Transcript_19156:417-1037(+)
MRRGPAQRAAGLPSERPAAQRAGVHAAARSLSSYADAPHTWGSELVNSRVSKCHAGVQVKASQGRTWRQRQWRARNVAASSGRSASAGASSAHGVLFPRRARSSKFRNRYRAASAGGPTARAAAAASGGRFSCLGGSCSSRGRRLRRGSFSDAMVYAMGNRLRSSLGRFWHVTRDGSFADAAARSRDAPATSQVKLLLRGRNSSSN